MWHKSRWAKQVFSWRKGIILGVLVLMVAASAPSSERIGDRVQIALPVLGLGCAVLTGGAGEYLLRYTALELVVQGSKLGLGHASINQRPRGGNLGFPSGHTAAASFGASALVQECVRHSPFVQGVVILAAAFTGASRIDAGAHDIWQVLAGAVMGWGMERLLRRKTPLRRGLCTMFGRLFRCRRRGPPRA